MAKKPDMIERVCVVVLFADIVAVIALIVRMALRGL
jgi:hypothetical protein